MKSRTLIVLFCGFLLLATLTAAMLAVCHHRVRVVEGISGEPLEGAYVTVERSGQPTVEVGVTDADGELSFWTSPFAIPERVCAQKTFYAPDCIHGIRPGLQTIELAVP